MNSTEAALPVPDMEKILELCMDLFRAGRCTDVLNGPTVEDESYYRDRAEVRLYDQDLFDYDFATPGELQGMLFRMWEYQQCEYMKPFGAAATIAAFRHRAEECVEAAIPAFIYQF